MELFLLGAALGASLVYAAQRMGLLPSRRGEQEVVEELLEELGRKGKEVVDQVEQQKRELQQLLDQARVQSHAWSRQEPGPMQPREKPATTGQIQGDLPPRHLDITSSPEALPVDEAGPMGAFHQEILQRAAGGLSPGQIARQLNLGIGEVQLVLNLFQRH